MRQAKRRIWAGVICEQVVYNLPDKARNIKDSQPQKPRFDSEEERKEHRMGISRRTHYRNFQANFSPTSLYSTLTFDLEHEIHDFIDARRIRNNFMKVLKRACPDAVIFCYMGRGKATHRIHFHMVSEGIPEEVIREKWKYGTICRIETLRAHNYFNGVDRGQDYTGLATYLFDHWTEEVGGHHWYQTKNAKKPETEPAKEVKVRGGYTKDRPPKAPKGYTLIDITATKYGCIHYIYVALPVKRKYTRRKNRSPDRFD